MKKDCFSKTSTLWLTATLCCLLWGSAFPSVKAGYRLFAIAPNDTASIILFAGVRFCLAGVLTVILYCLYTRRSPFPCRSAWKHIGVLSLFQTVMQYSCFYLGLAFTTGVRGSLISGTGAFFALLTAIFIFKMESLSAQKTVGCLLGFLGVLLVNLEVFQQENLLNIGDGMMLLSAFAYGVASVLMKRYAAETAPALLSGWQFIIGGLAMSAAAWAAGGTIPQWRLAGGILWLYLAVVSAVAYSLWSVLLKYYSVAKVAVCSFMTPVFGFILSAFFNGEHAAFHPLSLPALLCVATGIILVHYRRHEKDAA